MILVSFETMKDRDQFGLACLVYELICYSIPDYDKSLIIRDCSYFCNNHVERGTDKKPTEQSLAETFSTWNGVVKAVVIDDVKEEIKT